MHTHTFRAPQIHTCSQELIRPTLKHTHTLWPLTLTRTLIDPGFRTTRTHILVLIQQFIFSEWSSSKEGHTYYIVRAWRTNLGNIMFEPDRLLVSKLAVFLVKLYSLVLSVRVHTCKIGINCVFIPHDVTKTKCVWKEWVKHRLLETQLMAVFSWYVFQCSVTLRIKGRCVKVYWMVPGIEKTWMFIYLGTNGD